jgi:hypothetical protein
MVKFLIAFFLVAVVLVGALIGLWRGRVQLPPQDVLDRVRRREQELEAQERLERGE